MPRIFQVEQIIEADNPDRRFTRNKPPVKVRRANRPSLPRAIQLARRWVKHTGQHAFIYRLVFDDEANMHRWPCYRVVWCSTSGVAQVREHRGQAPDAPERLAIASHEMRLAEIERDKRSQLNTTVVEGLP